MIPGSFCVSAKYVRSLVAFLAFCLMGSMAFAQTDNWTGTTGVWSDSAQWDSGVPVAGDNIVIGTSSASSTDDFSLGIGSLTLSNAADTLSIADGVALNASGTISNAGTIQLSSAGSNTALQITGNVSLTGTGKVILGTTGPNYIVGASGAGTEVLTNANTIQGVGNIGNGIMGLVNNGTIIANSSVGNLFINPSAANFSNSGTLEAITGGNLTIQGPANSFTNFNASTGTLTGGTYTANGGNIYLAAGANGITTLLGRVTEEASGQMINTTTGTNAFANLASIPVGGVLTTTAGFTQPGAFSMAGSLNILPKTVINVGSVTQIVNNALTGGQWVMDFNLNITGTPANIVTNSATVTLSGGTFKNISTGTDAFANLNSNKKTLRIMNFAHFNTVGTLTNSGQMTISSGCKLSIGGGSTKSYTQTGGKTTMDGQIIGAVAIKSGTYLGAGSITGNVSLGGTSAAIFSLGDTGKPALVKVAGNYTQLSTGKLSAGIGGSVVGTQFSQLQVTSPGVVNLAGTLSAPLLGTFVPTVGETFTVLSANSVNGTFSNSTIAINSSEHFAISYTAQTVTLTVVSGPAAQ
jgi:hypothetical protein